MGSALDYLVLGLYFAVMLGAGYWGLRRAGSTEDYLVAGRRLGPALYIGTLSAVVLGGLRPSAASPWGTSSASRGCGSCS